MAAEPDLDRAVMLAFIPSLQSAIRTGSDGGRVTLEVPETEMGEFAKLLGMKQRRLRVTIEAFEETKKPSRKIDSR